MRKLLLALLLTLSFTTAFASNGKYDGIYQSAAGLVTVQENNGTMVFVLLNSDTGWYNPAVGNRSGNVFKLESLMAPIDAKYTVSILSDTKMSVIQTSCKPLYNNVTCKYRDGTVFTMDKVF